MLTLETRFEIFSRLPDRALGYVLLVSKSTHSEAMPIVSARKECLKVFFDETRAKLTQKYRALCLDVNSDETRVQFTNCNMRQSSITVYNLRLVKKELDMIRVTSTVTTRAMLLHGAAFAPLFAETIRDDHMVLQPRTKKRWASRDGSLFYLRPYPEDPVALICKALRDGLF